MANDTQNMSVVTALEHFDASLPSDERLMEIMDQGAARSGPDFVEALNAHVSHEVRMTTGEAVLAAIARQKDKADNIKSLVVMFTTGQYVQDQLARHHDEQIALEKLYPRLKPPRNLGLE